MLIVLRLPNIIFLFEFLRSMVFTIPSVSLIGDRNLRRKEITALLGAMCSKTYPSFLTVKEGSTSHLGLLPSGKKRKTALLGARNRYALGLADHQRSAPSFAGWDLKGKVCYSNTFCFDNSSNEATNQKCHYAYRCRLKSESILYHFVSKLKANLMLYDIPYILYSLTLKDVAYILVARFLFLPK